MYLLVWIKLVWGIADNSPELPNFPAIWYMLLSATYRVHCVLNLFIHIIQSIQSIDILIAFPPYEVFLKCLTILVQETHQFILVRSKNTNLQATSYRMYITIII